MPADPGFDGRWFVLTSVLCGVASGDDPCDLFNDVADQRGPGDVVDACGLGRASAEGCDRTIDGVSPFRLCDVYALFVAPVGLAR